MFADRWYYKEHLCEVDEDVEDDNIKLFHFVTTPSGERHFADISPYESGRRVVELWIDAGYPNRSQGKYPRGPLHTDDLEMIIDTQTKVASDSPL